MYFFAFLFKFALFSNALMSVQHGVSLPQKFELTGSFSETGPDHSGQVHLDRYHQLDERGIHANVHFQPRHDSAVERATAPCQ